MDEFDGLVDFGKTQVYGEALLKIVGVEPDYEETDGVTRIYYSPEKLPEARESFANMMDSPPGNIQFDFMPVVTPYALKKYGMYALGLIALGYLFGSK